MRCIVKLRDIYCQKKNTPRHPVPNSKISSISNANEGGAICLFRHHARGHFPKADDTCNVPQCLVVLLREAIEKLLDLRVWPA